MIYFGIVRHEGTLKAEFGPFEKRRDHSKDIHYADTRLLGFEQLQKITNDKFRSSANHAQNEFRHNSPTYQKAYPEDSVGQYRRIKGDFNAQSIGACMMGLVNLRRSLDALEKNLVTLDDFSDPEEPIDFTARYKERYGNMHALFDLGQNIIPQELDERNEELIKNPKPLPQKLKRRTVDFADLLPSLGRS